MQTVSEWMDFILRAANIVILCFGLYKFFGKPHSTLEQRVTTDEQRISNNEKEIAEIKASLSKGNKRFDYIVKGLEIIMRSVVALIEFEANYCMSEHKEFSEGLKESKKELDRYLSSIGRGLNE